MGRYTGKRNRIPQAHAVRQKELAKGKTAFDRILADESDPHTERNFRRKIQNSGIPKRIQRRKPFDPTTRGNWYFKYLRSPLWRRKIRPRVLRRDGHQCRVCNSRERVQVHHIAYTREVLKGRADYLLVTVCRICHEMIEFGTTNRADRKVRTVKEKVVAYEQLAADFLAGTYRPHDGQRGTSHAAPEGEVVAVNSNAQDPQFGYRALAVAQAETIAPGNAVEVVILG